MVIVYSMTSMTVWTWVWSKTRKAHLVPDSILTRHVGQVLTAKCGADIIPMSSDARMTDDDKCLTCRRMQAAEVNP